MNKYFSAQMSATPLRAALVASAVLLLVLGYFMFGMVNADAPIVNRFDAANAPMQNSFATAIVGRDARVDLAGDMAQFILVPYDTSPADALLKFQQGHGTAFGTLETLTSPTLAAGPASLYVWFSYRTAGAAPIVLRYRTFNPLLAAVWLADDAATSFDLIALAGADAPRYRKALSAGDAASLPLLPSLYLPGSVERPRQVLVRVDSISPYWPGFSLYTRYAYSSQRQVGEYLEGVFLGATLVAMAFAVYGLYRRLAIDYLTFLLAATAMSLWHLIRGEHVFGTDWTFVRRLTLMGPVFAYFLLHGIGVKHLLYSPTKWTRGFSTYLRQAPLWLVLGISSLGILTTLFYALLGMRTTGADLIDSFSQWFFVLAPLLLLIAVVVTPNRRLSGYAQLIAAEVAGALGCVLQFVHMNVSWLDGVLKEALIQYALPIEVLIWAAALSSRFYYLEMLAKRKVKAALRREAARVRLAMQVNVLSREEALQALDVSYQALDQARSRMQGIIDTHAHAARNLLMKLGGHLDGIRRHSMAESPASMLAAAKVLIELADAVDDAEYAVREVQSQHAAAPAQSLLSWRVSAVYERLAQRDVTIHLNIAEACEGRLVDGFHFMEVTRELFSNVSRYASNGTVVVVTLDVNSTHVVLTVQNTGVLREDEQALRFGWPVSPASSTLNGEYSSGRGLATLHALLSGIGGAIQYRSEPPDQVIVTATFPCR